MKYQKLVTLIGALVGITVFSLPVQAATKPTANKSAVQKKTTKTKVNLSAIKTNSKLSYIILNRNSYYYNNENKRTKSRLKKNHGYRIYYVRHSGERTFYGTKTKKWILSSATRGTVWYQEDDNNTMILTTNKKGKLSYTLYDPAQVTPLILKRNSYIYNDQGILQLEKGGTVTTLKKGRKVKGYSLQKVNGQKFYITDQGWIKANNVAVYKATKPVKKEHK